MHSTRVPTYLSAGADRSRGSRGGVKSATRQSTGKAERESDNEIKPEKEQKSVFL